MTELRSVPRWDVKKNTYVRMNEESESVGCFLEDLSLKGMRISFKQPLPIKRFIRMSLTLNQHEEIVVVADIRWSHTQEGTHTYGICFQHIESKHQDQIYQFLYHNFSEQWHHRWREAVVSMAKDQDQEFNKN